MQALVARLRALSLSVVLLVLVQGAPQAPESFFCGPGSDNKFTQHNLTAVESDDLITLDIGPGSGVAPNSVCCQEEPTAKGICTIKHFQLLFDQSAKGAGNFTADLRASKVGLVFDGSGFACGRESAKDSCTMDLKVQELAASASWRIFNMAYVDGSGSRGRMGRSRTAASQRLTTWEGRLCNRWGSLVLRAVSFNSVFRRYRTSCPRSSLIFPFL